MIAAIDPGFVAVGILSAIGGIIGGIAVWRKVGPERTQIVVSTTEKAFVIQAGVLEDVYAELERQRAETASARAEAEASRAMALACAEESAALRRRIDEIVLSSPSADQFAELQTRNRDLEDQLNAARSEVATYRAENEDLRARVGDLETELAEIRNGGK